MNYRQDPRVSQTLLKAYWISPKAGDWAAANPKESTPAMELGTLVHDIVLLGPSSLEKYRTDAPVNDKTGEPFGVTSKKYQDWKATIEQDGYIAANPAMIAKAQMMAGALSKEAIDILDACQSKEKELYWEQSGIPMKGKPDAWKTGDYLVELKTTRKPLNAQSLQREIITMLYDLQCAAYRNGIGGLTRSVIIWLSEANGGDCAVTWLDDGWQAHGQKNLDRAIGNYKLAGLGIGQSPDSIVLELPAWATESDLVLTSETEGELEI